VTSTIPDFSQLRVLVVGDAMLDEYWFGDTARISPEAPVPVVQTREIEQRPGGAANVALNIAALGGQVQLLTIVGDDQRADDLAGLLADKGVRCEFITAIGRPTSHKLRVLSRNQQLIRLDSEESLVGHESAVQDAFEGCLDGIDAIVLSDYGKGTLNRIEPLIAEGRAKGIPVLVDPKGVDFERYRGASIITPNQHEFEAVVGKAENEDDFRTAGETLRLSLALDALLVTRGDKGMTLFAAAAQPIELAAQAREVFDVTGAGDTVIGLMAAGLGRGLSWGDSAALANLGAGLVVRKIGVATVSASELSLALHSRGAGGRGVVSEEELQALIEEARARNERIVMTNGCFDLLHVGHVSYLEEAKGLGDRLVVAVNDDASVRQIRGATRPISPLADRMAVLAALAAVDWVLPFSETTPERLISRILPDVLVKGGDYRSDEIVGGPAVVAKGGEVRVLQLVEGRSTSALIEAMKKLS
jgi:D-beta-D-heptose 7-phosphate kinase/D-beta-D-heptose 1-phosphate adenosyltransferase